MNNPEARNGDLNDLINELEHGRGAATQLQMILNSPSSSSYSIETRELLVHNVLSSYDRALTMLNHAPPPETAAPPPGFSFGVESPSSFAGSPHSEDSDRELDGSSSLSKKKNAPRWTKKVRISPGSRLEVHLDDGFSWRKYGQKDILGARFPRGYYRCTHRHAQGCLATKYVQRSDDDPNIIDITYKGRHKCNHPNTPPPPPPENQEQNITEPQRVINPSETLLSFQRDLRVETTNLDNVNRLENQALLFPYTHNTFSLTSNFSDHDRAFGFGPSGNSNNNNNNSNNEFSWSVSPHFGSSASTAVSATNSPAFDPDFAFGASSMGFDSNFSFDNHGFFS